MKIYLVEYVDESFVSNLKLNHEIVDRIDTADIVITRNLRVDKRFIDQAKNLKLFPRLINKIIIFHI